MIQLSKRDRRALLICVVVVGGMLILGRGVPAANRWKSETHAAAVELVGEVALAERSLRDLPVVLDSLETRNERFASAAPALFGGDSPGAASSALASWVSGAASRSNCQLGAFYVQADTAQHGVFATIAVRGDLVTDVHDLAGFLLEIERGPALLAVRELSVDQPAPGNPDDRLEELRVQFRIEGLTLRPDETRGGLP